MPSGDWTRGEHQKTIITAIINKVSSNKDLLTNYADILNNSKDIIQTNIPTEVIKKYVRDQIEDMNSWHIDSTYVKGDGAVYQETYSAPGMKLYVMKPNEESRKEVSKQINNLLEKE